MFYKLMSNGIVVDLLREICYVRYLPKTKRWIGTEGLSAHGILGSDKNTIYHLDGRSCPCETLHPQVIIEQISEEEYNKFSNEIALRKKENEQLINRIDALEATLAYQNTLIEKLLQKFEG